MAAIEISLAGHVAIGTAGQSSGEAALGERSRVVLAYLALERWRPVTHHELANVVWGGELPDTWPAALRGIVSRVRAALRDAGVGPAGTLTSGPGGYQLQLLPGSSVDVEVAQEHLGAARSALAVEPGQARDQAAAALAILRGEFLAGVDGVWVERRRAELTELHLQCLEVLSEASAACGDVEGAVWAAEEAVSRQPLRESAHLCAMGAHGRARNRARALRAYERCRRVLAEELGAVPGPEMEAAYVALLGAEPTLSALPEHKATGNLPAALTRFVGRVGERSEVEALLGSTRLLTVTGPGGSGKSRLSLEVAPGLASDYPDGVWLVELAGLSEAGILADHISTVLGVAGTRSTGALEGLKAHVGGRRLLLVLDNCEHLVAACADLVDRLLRACPGLTVLATSREPLGVDGETVWIIPPLAVPGPDAAGAPLDVLLGYDAVALFADRALAADPRLALEPLASHVATICQRLDGIPLALELAAAQARSMGLAEIADRLGDRFRLLVGGSRTAPARHQTLQAALDWSYEALSVEERRLFAGVSVFAGDFSIAATEAICPDGAAGALGTLRRLVEKSLVVADCSGGRGRYRLLETMRQYGYAALVDSGLEFAARSVQLRWSAALVEEAEAGLEGPGQATCLQMLDAEHDNLRGVLDWAAAHDAGLWGHRIAAGLWRYWEIRGLLREGRARLEALLDGDAPAPLRAKALNAAGVLAQHQGDHTAARDFYQRAYDARRDLGDRAGMAASLNGLGNMAVGTDDLLEARAIFEQNLRTSRELGDDRLLAASLMNLGVVAQLLFVGGRMDPAEGATQAHALYLESLALYRRLGDRRGTSQALENLGVVAPYRGDDATAHVCLEESLLMRRELQDRSGIAASARFLGHLALKRGEYGAARSLHEECLAIERDLGNELLVAADLASLAQVEAAQARQAEPLI